VTQGREGRGALTSALPSLNAARFAALSASGTRLEYSNASRPWEPRAASRSKQSLGGAGVDD
jgi:hypothetical protein